MNQYDARQQFIDGLAATVSISAAERSATASMRTPRAACARQYRIKFSGADYFFRVRKGAARCLLLCARPATNGSSRLTES